MRIHARFIYDQGYWFLKSSIEFRICDEKFICFLVMRWVWISLSERTNRGSFWCRHTPSFREEYNAVESPRLHSPLEMQPSCTMLQACQIPGAILQVYPFVLCCKRSPARTPAVFRREKRNVPYRWRPLPSPPLPRRNSQATRNISWRSATNWLSFLRWSRCSHPYPRPVSTRLLLKLFVFFFLFLSFKFSDNGF